MKIDNAEKDKIKAMFNKTWLVPVCFAGALFVGIATVISTSHLYNEYISKECSTTLKSKTNIEQSDTSASVAVPDFTGYTLEEAQIIAKDINIKINVKELKSTAMYNNRVYKQDIVAGTIVNENSVVNISIK